MVQKTILFFLFICVMTSGFSQEKYWQQSVDYTIRVKLDAGSHVLYGQEVLEYTNNSPDTLFTVYYHLYLNAFQPGSSMDVRSRTIADPDSRVLDRISKLKPDETGEYFIRTLSQGSKPVKNFTVHETILVVELHSPLLPGKTTTLDMSFECQIPIQIRRTGRYNSEGVAYSMAQWYPKLCEYDQNGWATDPYIGREFYGVWGNFNVYITLPDSFKIAGTGDLIAKLDAPVLSTSGKKNENFEKDVKWSTYFFKAEKVHDFVWTADPQYVLDEYKVSKDLKLIFAYKSNLKNIDNWRKLQPIMAEAITFASDYFGKYPYHQFSFIQGGDGGMEYPKATLVMGELSLGALTSVCIHEMMHSWYQGVLGINESAYPWMDEGFTSYAEEIVKNFLKSKKMYPGTPTQFIFKGENARLVNFYNSGKAEPLSTHADHFHTNAAYGVGSYTKGCVFLSQLGYVIGEENLKHLMQRFYSTWKYKHPTDQNFMRMAEKVSCMQLYWYHSYMINSNDLPDYSIDTVLSNGSKTIILLGNHGLMPMPVDVSVTDNKGKVYSYTIPLDLMLAAKRKDLSNINITQLPEWNWVNPFYEMAIDIPIDKIRTIEIDPTKRMVDLDLTNNILVLPDNG
ncbi:MAG TPA: M1 family metallopeptidase [Saprospiraceae bacterium]|nr:M1 family metallopeptidase [Saprospiraceae bacterium]HQW56348.1 M1 family metallopeptidase [Saprospiraceae bacterium]